MPKLPIFLLFTLFFSLQLIQGFVITIAPRSQECFIEDLQFKERMLATYEVVSGGMLDINVRVTGPDGKLIYEQEREKEGNLQFFALQKGTYQICFSNSMSTMTSKMLSFNIYSGHELHRFQNAKSDNVEPLDKAVMAVTESIRKLTDTYSYVRTRVYACKWTVESAEDTVWFWGILNIILAIVALALRTIFIVKPFSVNGPIAGGNMNPFMGGSARHGNFGGI
jgi:hypothetical protein